MGEGVAVFLARRRRRNFRFWRPSGPRGAKRTSKMESAHRGAPAGEVSAAGCAISCQNRRPRNCGHAPQNCGHAPWPQKWGQLFDPTFGASFDNGEIEGVGGLSTREIQRGQWIAFSRSGGQKCATIWANFLAQNVSKSGARFFPIVNARKKSWSHFWGQF